MGAFKNGIPNNLLSKTSFLKEVRLRCRKARISAKGSINDVYLKGMKTRIVEMSEMEMRHQLHQAWLNGCKRWSHGDAVSALYNTYLNIVKEGKTVNPIEAVVDILNPPAITSFVIGSDKVCYRD
jgi:hypothetical protein